LVEKAAASPATEILVCYPSSIVDELLIVLIMLFLPMNDFGTT
jgi:hypothetical protein